MIGVPSRSVQKLIFVPSRLGSTSDPGFFLFELHFVHKFENTKVSAAALCFVFSKVGVAMRSTGYCALGFCLVGLG